MIVTQSGRQPGTLLGLTEDCLSPPFLVHDRVACARDKGRTLRSALKPNVASEDLTSTEADGQRRLVFTGGKPVVKSSRAAVEWWSYGFPCFGRGLHSGTKSRTLASIDTVPRQKESQQRSGAFHTAYAHCLHAQLTMDQKS